MGTLFKTCEGLCRSINTLQWRLEVYDNELRLVLNEREACAKSLKQLEDALADVPSTNKEKEVVAREEKAESSKCGTSCARGSEEEEEDEEEEESKEEEDAEEEDELVGSSGMSAKVKGKGCTK